MNEISSATFDIRGLAERIRALLASQQEHPAIAEQCLREAAATIERLLAEREEAAEKDVQDALSNALMYAGSYARLGRSAFKSIQVYDRVIVGERCWAVAAVYVGALGYENVVELACADGIKSNGSRLLVPLELIPASAVFREVDHHARQALQDSKP